ncbi:MAG: hypothetical protein PHT51_03185 [Patescibacteria group bacterium]|nr:hypothetical protein [Patescibacteria group bacterium]MDD4611121.1 hypothetical protein [Patescibacteria group bacterium]
MTKFNIFSTLGVKKMKSKKSILWSDATLYEDFKLIKFLVDNIVAGDREYKNICVEKIFLNIQKKSWQKNYPVRSFIFLIYYSFIVEIADIKTMLSCQSLEIIYYLKFGEQTKDNFKTKVERLYNCYYSFTFKSDTANIIRIIRNNVAHTGTIDGIWGKYKLHDQVSINNFLSIHNELKNIRLIAFSFNLLIQDMVIRILGLNLKDLSINGLQPFNNKYFKNI